MRSLCQKQNYIWQVQTETFVGYFKSDYSLQDCDEILKSLDFTHTEYLNCFCPQDSHLHVLGMLLVCVSGRLCACVAWAYICFYISECMCGFWEKLQALHSSKRSAPLKFSQLIVFHIRRVRCTQLKWSTGTGRENDFTWRFSAFWMNWELRGKDNLNIIKSLDKFSWSRLLRGGFYSGSMMKL